MKGLAQPLVTFIVLALAAMGGLGAWWLGHSSLNNLFEGVLALGGMLSVLAMGTGFVMGAQVNTASVLVFALWAFIQARRKDHVNQLDD